MMETKNRRFYWRSVKITLYKLRYIIASVYAPICCVCDRVATAEAFLSLVSVKNDNVLEMIPGLAAFLGGAITICQVAEI